MYSVMLLSEGREPDSRPDEEIKPEVSPLVPAPRFPVPRVPVPRVPDPRPPDPRELVPSDPDPREPVARDPEPRVKLEGAGLERLPSEEFWRLLWD